jgi:hypothetical protein
MLHTEAVLESRLACLGKYSPVPKDKKGGAKNSTLVIVIIEMGA